MKTLGKTRPDELIALSGDILASSGDMLKSVYDSDEDGKVNIAETAETVEWTGVQNKPAFLAFAGLTKITVGATEPTSPSVGDLWIDTN